MPFSYFTSVPCFMEENLPSTNPRLVLMLKKQVFPGGSAGKESARNIGDLGSIPGLGRSRRGGKGYPLQYSGLENSLDCIVHGVAKSRTRLSDSHFTFFSKNKQPASPGSCSQPGSHLHTPCLSCLPLSFLPFLPPFPFSYAHTHTHVHTHAHTRTPVT